MKFEDCCYKPHQIYGKNDNISFPNIIQESKKSLVRIMGAGENIYYFFYVAYALILGGNTLLSKNYKDFF